MRLKTIVLTILFFGSACVKEVPEGIVPEKQMTALLIDMHLADGQLASMMIDSARVYRDDYYQAIFNRYAVDSTTFERSIEFYSTRPALMKELYINIEKQLEAFNRAEQQAIEEKYTTQRKADSIANVRRTDSLQKVKRDSLDFTRKRYLLYLEGPDSLLYGRPVPVTHSLLTERLFEALGLRGGSQWGKETPKVTDSTAPPVPSMGEPSMPPLMPINNIR